MGTTIAAELHRLGLPAPMAELPSYCTMRNTAELVGIPRGRGCFKWPRLGELFSHLFDRPHEGAHNSLDDVAATLACYCELSAVGFINGRASLFWPQNMHILGIQPPTAVDVPKLHGP